MKNTFYGIAVDIGMTTVAMSLMQWEKNSGNASADGELTKNADGRETGKKKNVGGPSAHENQLKAKKDRDKLIGDADGRGIIENLGNYDLESFSMHR